MTNVELADHLADDVTDIFAAVGVIHHCQVPLADAVPINAVHVRVIEIVAEDAPCILDHLLPFMLGIDFREHGLGNNWLAACSSRSVQNLQTHQHLLAISSELEAAAVGHFLDFLLLVLDVKHLDLAALAEDQLVFVIDAHAADAAGAKRQFNDA